MNTRQTAFELIDTERNRQDAKWGEQNHPPQFWTGILGEEYGEYCQAVNETIFDNGPRERLKGGYDNMIRELTHVAAVAVGAMECLMRDREKSVREDVPLSMFVSAIKCQRCRYYSMSHEEIQDYGGDPCETCSADLSNWKAKEEVRC